VDWGADVQGRIAILISLLFLPLSGNALGQVIAPGDEPGRIEQRFVPPPAPKAGVTIHQGLESTLPPDQAEKVVLKLRAIRIEGNTAFTDAELRDLFADQIGKKITLRDIFRIAAEITARYGKAGYTLSRAIVPPQDFNQSGATVTIRIIEGYVDKVVWPEGISRYRDLFSSYAEKIIAERPVRVQTIERYLLLANDLPGLRFSSKLRASDQNPAASTLEVALEDEDHFSLLLGVDNRGTEGSGPFQPSAVATASNLLGLHEEFKFGYIAAGPQEHSNREELDYLTFGYHQVLSSEGLAFDVAGNASWGKPGTSDLLLLDYQTDSLNVSGIMSYPLIRTRNTNLTGRVAFDWKNSESDFLGTLSTKDRLRIVRGELEFDHADEGNGVNQAILTLSQGIDGLGSTENGNPLASRSNGRVDFTKATLQLSRTQNLGGGNSAYVVGFGQLAANPLLSSQECGYGGGWIGRSFEPSVVTGDHCALLLGELRHDFNVETLGLSRLQFYSFADYGSVWNIGAPLGTAKHDEGASAGGGLRLGWKHLDADFQAAYQLDRPNSIAVKHRVGFFFDISARF
jgi:hemolysin activation/secretion protein